MPIQTQNAFLPQEYVDFYNRQSKRNPFLYPPQSQVIEQVEEWNDRDFLVLGNTLSDMTGEPVKIPLYDEHSTRRRIGMFVVGPPGTGKSIFVKDCAYQIHFNLKEPMSVFCDPQMEFQDASEMLPQITQQHINAFGDKKFKPQKLPVRTYIPKYCFNEYNNFNPPPKSMLKAKQICINMSDLKLSDIFTLMQVPKEDKDVSANNLRNAVEELWDTVFTKRYPDPKTRNVQSLLECLDSMNPKGESAKDDENYLHIRTYETLRFRIRRLTNKNVLGDNNINFWQDIREGYVPVLSNKGSESPYFDSTYATAVAQPVYNACTQSTSESKAMWYIGDEIQRLGFNGSTFAKFLDFNLLRFNRKTIQNVIVATQAIKPTTGATSEMANMEVDPSIIKDCTHLIIFKLRSEEDIEFLGNHNGLDIPPAELKDEIKSLNFNPATWESEALCVSETGIQRFYKLPPLLGHRFEPTKKKKM